MDTKHSGKVRFFDTNKGFGFITPDDGTADVFFHFSSVEAINFQVVPEGTKVEYSFNPPLKGKGPTANFVSVVQ